MSDKPVEPFKCKEVKGVKEINEYIRAGYEVVRIYVSGNTPTVLMVKKH